jgi:DNA-directed RNA polymerase specialized sigma24 family protein
MTTPLDIARRMSTDQMRTTLKAAFEDINSSPIEIHLRAEQKRDEDLRIRDENVRLIKQNDILTSLAAAKVDHIVAIAEANTETMRRMQLEFLGTLKTERDVIVWQGRMKGKTVREIAKETGMSIGTTHGDLKRLVSQFDQRLQHQKVKTEFVPLIDEKDLDDREHPHPCGHEEDEGNND